MSKQNNTVLRIIMATMLLFSLIACTASGNKNGTVNVNQGGIKNMDVVNNNSDYEKWWQEADSFYSQGLPKSALEVVDKIYTAAKEKNNAAEFIKALIYKLRFIQEVEEDSPAKIHKQLTDDLAQSQFPITPVLHSMLAEQYWNYYQSNRYLFLNRTNIADADIKQDDINTWDLKKIIQEIVNHYLKSLEDAEKAKTTKIDIYDKILIKGNNTR
ncbi:MAG TPA: hypothetical protein VK186_25255, partial [Candidatus Deferrimicrobium sp.]|nr:hypothetical protein [Candidatus Deferrimicrobium sp.]